MIKSKTRNEARITRNGADIEREQKPWDIYFWIWACLKAERMKIRKMKGMI